MSPPPLTLTQPKAYNLTRFRWPILLVLTIAVAVGSALFFWFSELSLKEARGDFQRHASARHALIRETLLSYEECLSNLYNLFTNSTDVTRVEFNNAAEDILNRHDGIMALEWVPLVTKENRASFTEQARREVDPAYEIIEQLSDGTYTPAGERDLYYPVLYLSPPEDNQSALGYDFNTSPIRSDLERSLASREMVLTRNFHLSPIGLDSEAHGVIMARPVFKKINGVTQPIGFVQIVFKVKDMMRKPWAAYRTGGAMDTLILDLTEPNSADPFIFSHRSPGDHKLKPLNTLSDLDAEFRLFRSLEMGGRTWGCYYAPSHGWVSTNVGASPWTAFFAGFSFTVLLGAYFITLVRRAALINQKVHQRTAELRESRRQLESLMLQMPGMVYRFDAQSPPQAIFISQGSYDIIGYTAEELTSGAITYEALILSDDLPLRRQIIDTALTAQKPYECEYRLLHKDGTITWVLDRGQGIYSETGQLILTEGLAINITGRKQAEAEKAELDRRLLESQKLESLGVLAGGIAHDFNNLLTGILGHANIARHDLSQHSHLHQNLSQIEAGAKRAAELCRQLLAYAGKGQFVIQQTSLEKLVRETTPLLEHSITKNAHLVFKFGPDVPNIEGDTSQICQIIMNLVMNASEAIGDKDGTITIQTSTIHGNDPSLTQAIIPLEPSEKRFASLSVTDTGCGMDATTLARIFDPFFTTKFTGRGLGLAAVLGIIRSHQGSLIVTSTKGTGSTFTLLLPACVNLPSSKNVTRTPFETTTPQRSGTVLVIDDDETVHSVTQKILGIIGLKTLRAVDGVEGLTQFAQHQTEISFVMLDLTMPRMGGLEACQYFRARAPSMPIILMSGYSGNYASEFQSDPNIHFLQKPFTLNELRSLVRHLVP